MAYRVGVASSDGKFINQHFGRARQFLIFDVTAGDTPTAEFVALRENAPPCGYGQHDKNMLDKTVELLADCQIVLVTKVGPGAQAALSAKGITALEITLFIDEALAKVGRNIHRILPGKNEHGSV